MRIHAYLDPQPYFLATNHRNGDWCVQFYKIKKIPMKNSPVFLVPGNYFLFFIAEGAIDYRY